MARAVAIINFLRKQKGSWYQKFVATTVSGVDPLESNSTKCGMARKRSVVIEISEVVQWGDVRDRVGHPLQGA